MTEETWRVTGLAVMKVTLFHPSAPSYWLCESCTKNPIPRSLLYVCVRGSACQSIVQMLEVSVTSRGIFFSSGRWEKEGSYQVPWSIFISRVHACAHTCRACTPTWPHTQHAGSCMYAHPGLLSRICIVYNAPRIVPGPRVSPFQPVICRTPRPSSPPVPLLDSGP